MPPLISGAQLPHVSLVQTFIQGEQLRLHHARMLLARTGDILDGPVQ